MSSCWPCPPAHQARMHLRARQRRLRPAPRADLPLRPRGTATYPIHGSPPCASTLARQPRPGCLVMCACHAPSEPITVDAAIPGRSYTQPDCLDTMPHHPAMLPLLLLTCLRRPPLGSLCLFISSPSSRPPLLCFCAVANTCSSADCKPFPFNSKHGGRIRGGILRGKHGTFEMRQTADVGAAAQPALAAVVIGAAAQPP